MEDLDKDLRELEQEETIIPQKNKKGKINIIDKTHLNIIKQEDVNNILPNTLLDDKLSNFLKGEIDVIKKPLKKIIDNMLKTCEYMNGDSLERHNWGEKPKKLKYIPKNKYSEEEQQKIKKNKNIINSIKKNKEENIDSSNIELLWGDIQLGKRLHACIIMWFSIFILKRPVIYIFRNLKIDQKQLQDDILGTDEFNFNTQFIKKIFNLFNQEIQEFFDNEEDSDRYKKFKLTELRDINNGDILKKLNNKDAINPTDIFCCLMNDKQMDKINDKFNDYILENEELANITLLVDESDLFSPTSTNDTSNKKDIEQTTKSEQLLVKIYSKVKYALHITGTAHSLLYNITTRLNENESLQIPISKVHKMKRATDYYGLFSEKIIFNTEHITNWWSKNEENCKQTYTIEKDYGINIKNIINVILERKNMKYNSLLISEEKIRVNQFKIAEKILKDFKDIFVIVFHGNCLRFYFSKKYLQLIKFYSQKEKRLHNADGVFGSPKDYNNYHYYNIDTKKYNIKQLYKIMRMLFNDEQIKSKTVITITGKYGERGYSFTSDDYGDNSFHLTDQYFVSHANFNCTDISQRLRLQGKYNDNPELTLWTTIELQDVIQNFYVKFIKLIEKDIMKCQNWKKIKKLIENILDNGQLKLHKYMKHLDVVKKRKNIQVNKRFDKSMRGFKLIQIDDMTNEEISKWCKETNLPEYICINEIKSDLSIDEFINKYGTTKVEHKFIPINKNILPNDISTEFLNELLKKENLKYDISKSWLSERKQHLKNNKFCEPRNNKWEIKTINDIENDELYGIGKNINDNSRKTFCYDNEQLYLCIKHYGMQKTFPRETKNYIEKKKSHISKKIK